MYVHACNMVLFGMYGVQNVCMFTTRRVLTLLFFDIGKENLQPLHRDAIVDILLHKNVHEKHKVSYVCNGTFHYSPPYVRIHM